MATVKEAWPETSGTVAERIAALRARTVERVVPIHARAITRLWGQRMVLAAAFEASTDPVVPKPLRILCRATYDNLMGDLFADLDPTDETQAPTIAAFLDGLQAAGALTDEVRAETLALGRESAPEFTADETDYPALYAAGLISRAEAGLEGA